MRIRYQTGIATLVQFTSMTVLAAINGVFTSVESCSEGGNCTDNILVSVVLFMLIALFYGGVWVLGSAAQELRNKLLAIALAGIELLVVFVELFNIQNRGSLLSLAISIINLSLAIWVIVLAYRLSRARGGRIVKGAAGTGGTRKRRTPISKS